MIWKKFNALGSEIIATAAVGEDRARLLEETEKAVTDFEQRFSRFIEGNELDRLNKSEGEEFAASPMLVDLLKEAKAAYDLTEGVFDPTVIGSLEEVGYDRRFDAPEKFQAESGQPDLEGITRKFLSRQPFSKLEIRGSRILKPPGLRLDFGGLGKGYIVDWLSDNLFSSVADFWISAGGDLAVKGDADAGEGWKIGVQDPSQPEREKFWIRTKGLACGIATSGVFKRKGRRGDFVWHHLIDPRNGLPAENEILAVTVVSGNAKRADVFAKTVLILGQRQGMDFIEKQADSAAIAFTKDGRLLLSKRSLDFFQI